MKNIRYGLLVIWVFLCLVTSAAAQVSIGIGLPNVNIGINLPVFPHLVPVPGYPVYYAPGMDANYFFYDGMYWVYQNDNWYASSWYNGPWGFVDPAVVPLFILRIPVSYYRQPPVYFRGWQSHAPPRWGQHWGQGWEQRRSGWNRWKRGSGPAPAPLPVYQGQYSGDRYPQVEQQQMLRNQSYRYQSRDKVIRQHFQQQMRQKAPPPTQRGMQGEPPFGEPVRQDVQRPMPPQQGWPVDPRQQQVHPVGENNQRSAPDHNKPQQRGPAAHDQHQQPGALQHEQREPNRGHGQGQNKDDERGRGRDR